MPTRRAVPRAARLQGAGDKLRGLVADAVGERARSANVGAHREVSMHVSDRSRSPFSTLATHKIILEGLMDVLRRPVSEAPAACSGR